MGDRRTLDILTPAEWRVAEAVRHGLSNRTIAARQGVSVDAIKYHVANILSKLDLSNRQQLRRWERCPRRQCALRVVDKTMSEKPSLGALGQIAQHVGDIEAARDWYGEVLSLPHLYSFGKLAFFDCGG